MLEDRNNKRLVSKVKERGEGLNNKEEENKNSKENNSNIQSKYNSKGLNKMKINRVNINIRIREEKK